MINVIQRGLIQWGYYMCTLLCYLFGWIYLCYHYLLFNLMHTLALCNNPADPPPPTSNIITPSLTTSPQAHYIVDEWPLSLVLYYSLVSSEKFNPGRVWTQISGSASRRVTNWAKLAWKIEVNCNKVWQTKICWESSFQIRLYSYKQN